MAPAPKKRATRSQPARRTGPVTVWLVTGDDEFSIKEEAARLATELAPADAGAFGCDIVEGDCDNQDEAVQLLRRLNEALFTVGLFGGNKLVWLKNTSLLADTRTTGAEAVKDGLADLADQLKAGLPEGVKLLISAIGCDKRRALYKTLEKLADLRRFDVPDAGKAAGEQEIADFIRRQLAKLGKQMDPAAFEAFRLLIAPDYREIANELEKLDLYTGTRPAITETDVRAICSASRQAVIWDLTDSLGARRLGDSLAALRHLLDGGENPIGVLMMLVAQFRLMLLARDLIDRRVLVPGSPPNGAYQYVRRFQDLPETETAHFPRTKTGALPNAWRFYRCAWAARNFSTTELVNALETLTDVNRQLVSTGLDNQLVLEQAIVRIARQEKAA